MCSQCFNADNGCGNDMCGGIEYNNLNDNNGISTFDNSQSINEGIQERVVNRTFVHNVIHNQPIHTRVINHHVYRHIFRPTFTCSEENVCSNVEVGPCCGR